jgi:hypothetical protein
MTDDERESRIADIVAQIPLTTSRAKCRPLWDELVTLIEGRSAEIVNRMERERGIN